MAAPAEAMTPRPLPSGLPEPWAAEWGEDRFGLFTSFAVGEVVHRMRWIPPGSFLMGSPEGEAGRVMRGDAPRRQRGEDMSDASQWSVRTS